MARISNRDRVLDIVDSMSKKLQGEVANLLESIIDLQASEDLSDLEDATASSSRRNKADKKSKKKVKDEKPAKRGRKKKDEDDEDEAPKKRKSKKSKPEPFDGTPTLDDCYDFLSEFEGEPVEGGIRELKPEVKKLGGDPDLLTEGIESRSERSEELGMFIAANNALAAKLKLHDAEDVGELAEELGIDVDKVKTKGKQIAAILVALNSDEEPDDDEEDEDDEDEIEEEDDEDEEEDEAPKKRKSKKSKSKKEKSSKGKKRRSKKDEEDEEDEEDDDDGLDDIDDIDDLD